MATQIGPSSKRTMGQGKVQGIIQLKFEPPYLRWWDLGKYQELLYNSHGIAAASKPSNILFDNLEQVNLVRDKDN